MEEAELGAARDHQQSVGLGHSAGYLGEELGAGDPDGDGQPDPLADLAPQACGDLDGRPRVALQPADVEERLVDRDPLDQRCGLVEHLEDRPARVGIRGHPRWDDYCLWTQATGLRATHRRSYAARLRRVAGGQHDPGPDDDRSIEERRIVALLHRRIERVQISVLDRCLA